jgi:glycosyltransferase involved in cell wall biosynthesis
MPVWNGEAYVAEAMESILSQSFENFEFVIVDDGSTDSTLAILSRYRDPRLRVFQLQHAGIVSALNFAIGQARARWIARQDADDISHRSRLETQWRVVSANPSAVLCCTGIEIFGEGATGLRTNRVPRSKALAALRLCYQCPIGHSTVMYKKEAVLAAGGYDPDERHAEDYSLWGRLLEQGDFIGLPERILKFRVHAASVSKQNQEVQLALTRRIAIEHCRRFMGLTVAEGERAYAVLSCAPAKKAWKEWLWFLHHCIPRLRWKSAEMCAWLAIQTFRMAI